MKPPTFITLETEDTLLREYVLRLSDFHHAKNPAILNWMPTAEGRRRQNLTREHPSLRTSGALERALLDNEAHRKATDEFTSRSADGTYIIAGPPDKRMLRLVALLRLRLGRKVVLILSEMPGEDENVTRVLVGLAHTTILTNFNALVAMDKAMILPTEFCTVSQQGEYEEAFWDVLTQSEKLNAPLVSVVVTHYNAGDFLRDTLLSLQAQTMPYWEAVVVDDASDPIHLEKIRDLVKTDPRISVYGKPHGGIADTRNRGLSLCSPYSEYVVVMDGDDLMEPDHLETLAQTLNDNPDVIGAYGQITFIDTANEVIEDSDRLLLTSPPDGLLRAEDMVANCHIYPPSAAMFRIWAVNAAGPFDCYLPAGDDWEWLCRVTRLGHTRFVNRVLTRYRLHEENTTKHESFIQRYTATAQGCMPYLRHAIPPHLLREPVPVEDSPA